MAVSVATGVTTGGAVSVGFRPTGIVAWTAESPSVGAVNGNARLFLYLGRANGNAFSGSGGGVASANNVSTSKASNYTYTNTSALVTVDHTGSASTMFTFAITDTGITVTASGTGAASNPRLHYLLLGGDARCHVASTFLPNLNNGQTYTTTTSGGGFIPSAMIGFMIGASTLSGTTFRSMSVFSSTLSVAGQTVANGSYFEIKDDAGTSSTSWQTFGASFVSQESHYVEINADITSATQTQTGFSFLTTKDNNLIYVNGLYAALLIGDVAATSVDIADDASPSIIDFGMQTRGVFAHGGGDPAFGNALMSLGGITSTAQNFAAIRDRDAQAVTETHRISSTLGYFGQIATASNTMSRVLSRSTMNTSLQTAATTGTIPSAGLSFLAFGDPTRNLAGTISATATASATTLSKAQKFAGTGAATSTATASRLGRHILSTGVTSGGSLATATPRPLARFAGTLAGEGVAIGRIGGSAQFSGVSGGGSGLFGTATVLLSAIPLSGTVRARSGHVAYLGPVAFFTGTLTAASTTTASLSLSGAFTGQIEALSAATALRIRKQASLGGVTSGASTAATIIGVDVPLAGAVAGSAASAATITLAAGMAGASRAASFASASYTYPLPYLRPPATGENYGTINLVANPSLEYDGIGSAGWSGATLSRAETESWDGAYSAYATVEIGATETITIETQRGLSIAAGNWLCGSIAISGNVAATMTLTLHQANATTVVGDAVDIEASVSARRVYAPCVEATASVTHATLTITLTGPLEGTGETHLDAAQVEIDLGGQFTPFVSGDTDGGEWAGVSGNSPSIRQPSAG